MPTTGIPNTAIVQAPSVFAPSEAQQVLARLDRIIKLLERLQVLNPEEL